MRKLGCKKTSRFLSLNLKTFWNCTKCPYGTIKTRGTELYFAARRKKLLEDEKSTRLITIRYIELNHFLSSVTFFRLYGVYGAPHQWFKKKKFQETRFPVQNSLPVSLWNLLWMPFNTMYLVMVENHKLYDWVIQKCVFKRSQNKKLKICQDLGKSYMLTLLFGNFNEISTFALREPVEFLTSNFKIFQMLRENKGSQLSVFLRHCNFSKKTFPLWAKGKC